MQLKEKILNLRRKQSVLSNLYTYNLDEYDFIEKENTLLFFKEGHDFIRVYFISTDKNELLEIFKDFSSKKIVFNYPSKTDNSEITFFEKVDFSLIGVYERYVHHNVKYKNTHINYALLEDLDVVEKLIYNNFSVYMDNLPKQKELELMVNENRVLVNRENGSVKGFFIYTIISGRFYFNFWYDETQGGLNLLYQVYSLMHKKNITTAFFWVNKENKMVQDIHALMGAKKDGLIDYIYIK